ncbi:16S rRNA pseudouridine516 synthase [Sinobacterium caligoides]|uniref:Pseudouridine synthase n=1 Tax=Sinobacterium caligoides TaxID=933926 RepID=A0A3N2DMU8_9GAMM|nr:pseudouridine synthase [Sinobacterium caligoides]ROS01133.1 16S rRNA pseudouridine516 synthase [Sinobacterium caligoides]
MAAKRARLDRFISQHSHFDKRQVRALLARGEVLVDGVIARDIQQQVDAFSHICVAGEVLQDRQPHYLMLHKPVGVVSATIDEQHRTVFDLLDEKVRSIEGLHIVGRLDLNSSGLILLSNDGRWSQQLTAPGSKVEKHYRVGLANPLEQGYIDAFAAGMYFEFEQITTQPARLDIIDAHTAEVWLTEGRYHQIKRMFGRFRNPVLSLHRCAIGDITLDQQLQPGQYRALTTSELQSHNN